MKRILCIIVSLLIIISLFGCKSKKQEEEITMPSQKAQSGDVSVSVGNKHKEDIGQPQPDIFDEKTDPEQSLDAIETEQSDESFFEYQGEIIDEDGTEADITTESTAPYIEDSISDVAPVGFSSVEEMITSIKENKSPERYESSFNLLNVADIEFFYAPTAKIEGYQLEKIFVSYWNIEYVFIPIGEDKIVESDVVKIMYRRHERAKDKQELLQSVAENSNAKVTEEGFVYRQDINQVFFPVGESVGNILVPDSMNNYETLKPLCVAEKITIE